MYQKSKYGYNLAIQQRPSPQSRTMIDPVLAKVLLTAFTCGVCGSLVSVVLRFMNRSKPGPRLGQAAAVGFLLGVAFGAFFGIFQSMLIRQ